MQKLDKMSKKKFLVLGRAGIDIFPHPPGMKTENAENFFCHISLFFEVEHPKAPWNVKKSSIYHAKILGGT